MRVGFWRARCLRGPAAFTKKPGTEFTSVEDLWKDVGAAPLQFCMPYNQAMPEPPMIWHNWEVVQLMNKKYWMGRGQKAATQKGNSPWKYAHFSMMGGQGIVHKRYREATILLNMQSPIRTNIKKTFTFDNKGPLWSWPSQQVSATTWGKGWGNDSAI